MQNARMSMQDVPDDVRRGDDTMSTPKKSTAHYPLLREALGLLPGIAPRQERDRLGEAKYQASRSPSRAADFNGVQVTLTQLEEVFVHDRQGGPRVSPAGAALLLHLFKEGAFAPNEHKVKGDPELLAQYAKGLATLVPRSPRRGASRKARAQSGETARAARQSGPGAATIAPRAAPLAPPLASFNCFIHRLV